MWILSVSYTHLDVYKRQVYTRGYKKIGYLVYNHFTSGPNGYSDRTYDEEMKKIVAGFQAQGVNEFVLEDVYKRQVPFRSIPSGAHHSDCGQ